MGLTSGPKAGENGAHIGLRAGEGPTAGENGAHMGPKAGEHEDPTGPKTREHEDHMGPKAGEHEGHMLAGSINACDLNQRCLLEHE